MSGPIWKMEIPVGLFYVAGTPIHAAEQRGTPMVWYVNDGSSTACCLFTTGSEPEPGWLHVASFLADTGNFVGHLYREPHP